MIPTPAMRHLLQAYLTPDWPEDFGDAWSAVQEFAASEPELAPALAAEVEQILREVSSEAALRDLVVSELGSGYAPEGDGWTYRAWLTEVAQRVCG